MYANQNITPSISPSTIRTNTRGGISNSLFYHNLDGYDTATPISSNIPTSTTPGLDF